MFNLKEALLRKIVSLNPKIERDLLNSLINVSTRCPEKFKKQRNFIRHERKTPYQTRNETSKKMSENQKKTKHKMPRFVRKMSLKKPSQSIVQSMYNLLKSLKA